MYIQSFWDRGSTKYDTKNVIFKVSWAWALRCVIKQGCASPLPLSFEHAKVSIA